MSNQAVGFAPPVQYLSDEKIQSMNAAELKAEAHQRGWLFGDMGSRSARVRFWQLQRQYLGEPAAATHEDTKVNNATTAAERFARHEEQKGRPVEDSAKAAEASGRALSPREEEALKAMRENEAKNATPGVQPGKDDRTPEQKAAIDNNLESKRAAGLTGEEDKTIDPEQHKGSKIDVDAVENPEENAPQGDSEVDPNLVNNEGKLATDPETPPAPTEDETE